ncbi:peptidoglycan DD-metalloendopeptidase family protein [Thalassotalea sp. LPB0316]|uniref:peptidoglycan DD-metalloendopeptidase family protein n=1 Tax=Thalassotalea sp. LPB0316 TaxID=2769490 RepID=UPI001868E57C|nr:peptidoglycan DD-metalloendopeptidase family protein [Thalassotalea sp. LPB0316]QOL25798.1 peptidoglycan DD-metalloendopeptidase family protein [Thalassotalea sp. LPB0316]
MYKGAFLFCLLLLAGCSSKPHKPAPVVDIQGHVPITEQSKNTLKQSEYIVKKGETLYAIAWRANVSVEQLASINSISAPYHIYPGQKLSLKETKSRQNSSVKTPSQSNKYSTSESEKNVKKAVDQKKNQEYGGTQGGQKIDTKSAKKQSTFSQKIHRWLWPHNGKVIRTFSTKPQGNKGIDIAGRKGDNIKAAASGVVVYAGNALRGYGNLVIIKHNDDYLSAYAHNDRILVKEQQQINAGDVIAKMGDTDAQRVMLHFEVRFRGKSVNPQKYLPKK